MEYQNLNSLNIVLCDTPQAHADLLPLSFTRPIALFRVGICTILEKWQAMLPGRYSMMPVQYLREKYVAELTDDTLYIASNILPTPELARSLSRLEHGEALYSGDSFVGFRGDISRLQAADYRKVMFENAVDRIEFVFDVFRHNNRQILADYLRITAGRESQPLPEHCLFIGPKRLDDGTPALFIEPGATLLGCTVNTTDGPIYIGRDAQVMEGACLRGTLAIGEKVKVKMGARLYGGSSFGPYCKVAGEIDNTVIFGYSNKAHDGYLGNAVIGEWCNIGAGTNASNLKNDYSKIRIWNYPRHTFMRTELQFCGLIMGDHSKAGINCMFNTATVVGVGCNIHGAGFPRTFIPSFSEGSPAGGFSDVSLKKFYEIARRVMARRDVPLTEIDERIYARVFDVAAGYK